MKRIIEIFVYGCILLCGFGLGAYGLDAMRGEEGTNFYISGGGIALGVGVSALAGAGLGVVLGPIVGLILGSSAVTGARKGMMLGLLAGLIFGAYNEYNNFKDREPIPQYGLG
jgi:hypothetical protein